MSWEKEKQPKKEKHIQEKQNNNNKVSRL